MLPRFLSDYGMLLVLAALGAFLSVWTIAEPTFRRAIALGDTSADTEYALLYTLAALGRAEESTRLALAFIRRWPGDPRTRILGQALSGDAK